MSVVEVIPGSVCSENWEKIGQVTGGEGGDLQAGRSDLDGQSYDHVINVDIDDNRPPLKLGINQNDNPYDVADRSSPPVLSVPSSIMSVTGFCSSSDQGACFAPCGKGEGLHAKPLP